MKLRKNVRAWMRLDNAAQLYASSSSRRDPKVFRFACELNEPVDPTLLQQALESCLDTFQMFRCVLRRGLFWYFLELTDRMPSVTPEKTPPCSPPFHRYEHNFLFTVSYFQNRINLEVYHVLTDGTGALQFLRMLVYHYLLLRYPDTLGGNPPQMDFDASDSEKADDSFRKYYTGKPTRKRIRRAPAAHLQTSRLPDCRFFITAGEMPVKETLALAKSSGASLTAYICALLICAIHEEIPARERRKPISLTIPVNLRNYFESGSARNFFSVFNVDYTFSDQNDSLETVAAAVSKSFTEKLTPEHLSDQMNRMASIEYNPFSRALPLVLKDIGLAIGSRVASRRVSGGVSNLGRITMPDEMAPYIRVFDVFMGTARPQICACSFGDRLMITLVSPYSGTNIQKHFFRMLAQRGLDVTVHTNRPHETEHKKEAADAVL